jgi:hypothetical protein
MMCFKDKTFCTFYKDCAKSEQCDRPLTRQVEQDAKKWWGGDGYPIAVFVEKPDCHVEIILQKKNKCKLESAT